MSLRSLAESLNRPEYLYQPGKLIRRILTGNSTREGAEVVMLPWGVPLELDSSESIGRIISHHGIFEMPVVEAIFRLVDPSEIFLDVGANIGYMAAAAMAAGAKQVISFEPSPAIYPRLARNAQRWNQIPAFNGRIQVLQKGIHSESGVFTLFVPRSSNNDGLATLEAREEDDYDAVIVPTVTLDEVIQQLSGNVGTVKIDIEGHELQALNGAKQSLSRGGVRDILYEDFQGASSEVSKLLYSYGYSIFGLQTSVTGPVLRQSLALEGHRKGDHNLIATLDPLRLNSRMSARGYNCLSRKNKGRFLN
jgi:FkbM family methyltransferase